MFQYKGIMMGLGHFFERREIEWFEGKCSRESPHSCQWKSVYLWHGFPHTQSSVTFSHRLKTGGFFVVLGFFICLFYMQASTKHGTTCRVVILASSTVYVAGHSPDLLVLQTVTSVYTLTSPAFPNASPAMWLVLALRKEAKMFPRMFSCLLPSSSQR